MGRGKGDSVTAAVACNSSIELGDDETNQSTRGKSWNALCSITSWAIHLQERIVLAYIAISMVLASPSCSFTQCAGWYTTSCCIPTDPMHAASDWSSRIKYFLVCSF